jgi:predicted RND superfamily exporter protein
VLGIGLALAALGWALDTQTSVQTDLTKLVPQSMASLRNLDTLERASGVGGEVDLMVTAHDVARPAVIEWMSSYQSTVLRRFGYSATRGCGKALLCPAFSLPDLFSGSAGSAVQRASSAIAKATSQHAAGSSGSSKPAKSSGAAGSSTSPGSSKPSGSTGAKKPLGSTGSSKPAQSAKSKLSQKQVSGLLGAIPAYFSEDVITPNRRVATLAFGIRLTSLQRQQQVIETMRAHLHPPRGVQVQLVGLPVLAAQSGTIVASAWRRVLTLLGGLAAAALVLLAAFRGDFRRALTPLPPVVLATGWSALVVFAIRVPLNPMSVTLSALVIAISTEFSVLLAERHRQERLAGASLLQALHRTYSHTGAAIAASGVTAIMGFGVLVLSEIEMLRDFGVVTLVDLSVSLVGVLVALPATLLLFEGSEREQPARSSSGLGARLLARARPRHESA